MFFRYEAAGTVGPKLKEETVNLTSKNKKVIKTLLIIEIKERSVYGQRLL